MNLKKLLIILIIILVLVITALAVYNFFIKDKVSEEAEETQKTTDEEPKETEKTAEPGAGMTILAQEPVLGLTIDEGRVKYYAKANGNVFQCGFDGSGSRRISSANLQNLIKVLWSPSKDRVITIFEENSQLKKTYYDYTNNSTKLLNTNIGWISWSPVEDKIAYQYYDPISQENNISLANPDGSDWIKLMKTRMKDLIIEWPKAEIISLRTKASGLAQSVLYTIDRKTNNFEKVIPETYGLTVLWSPQGDKVLYSQTNNLGTNLQLKVLNLNENLTKELAIATLPEKCVWSQDNRTIFCAVPKNIPGKAVLPDDYWKGSVVFSDDFWQLNTDTEKVTQVFSAQAGTRLYNAHELRLSPNEDYLVFINRLDGLPYSLELE